MFLNDDLVWASEMRDGLARIQYRPEDEERRLDAVLARTRRVRASADLLIATAFEQSPDELPQQVAMALEQQEEAARNVLLGRMPFHWPVEFPEVFLDAGGFHAIVGNPPFIGGQWITGSLGQLYREYLVKYIAGNRRGRADYVAYFFLRAFKLLRSGGFAGLIATKTIAEGETRKVGLEALVREGAMIYRALASTTWPGEASLSVARVWWTSRPWLGTIYLDDRRVASITANLSAPGEVVGEPHRLQANINKCRQGTIISGKGFLIQREQADALIQKNPRNVDILVPYLGGKDVSERWDQSPSRWVINFGERSLEEAREFEECFEILERSVKLERANQKEKNGREQWWRFLRPRSELYESIDGLERALVGVRVSAYPCLVLSPTKVIFSDRLVVFALDSYAFYGALVSTIHDLWAHRPGSTKHVTRDTYFPEAAFDTFPLPERTDLLSNLGREYDECRKQVMEERREGLTQIWTRFHSPSECAPDIRHLRELQVEVDAAVAAAYGWASTDFDYGFVEVAGSLKFTMSESGRRKILDLLLTLNYDRHQAEVEGANSQSKPKHSLRAKKSLQSALF